MLHRVKESPVAVSEKLTRTSDELGMGVVPIDARVESKQMMT
jgi:hypothetical protein